ncbi:hypothetical protein N665_0104s0124, partial [Sinapis alba]
LVADGAFYAGLIEILTRELAEVRVAWEKRFLQNQNILIVWCLLCYLPSSNIRQIIIQENFQGGFEWRYLFLANLHQTLISY